MKSLEEVVVSARKREETVQAVPAAVTAISSETLTRLGVDELKDYFNFVPGMTYNVSAGGERAGPNVIIRGVGNSRIVQSDASSATQTTGFLLGDVPVAAVDTRLFDVKRIEVLKGPQGTLYGTGSMGGTVKVVPNEPNVDHVEAIVNTAGTLTDPASPNSSSAGFAVNAVANVPLQEGKSAARVVVYHRSDDGFVNFRQASLSETGNRSLPTPGVPFDPLDGATTELERNVDSEVTSGARVALLYQPSERVRVLSSILIEKRELDHPHNTDLNFNKGRYSDRFVKEPITAEFRLAALDATFQLGPVDLVSITGYSERENSSTQDFTNFVFGRKGGTASGTIPAPISLGFVNKTQMLTQELRLQSRGDGRIQWIVGGFYQDEQRDADLLSQSRDWNILATPAARIVTPGGLFYASDGKVDYENKAVFADVTWNLTKRLAVAAGVRRFDQTQDFLRVDVGDLPGGLTTTTYNVGENGTSPRANLSYRFGDDDSKLLYATYAEGFRIGGGNAVAGNDPVCQAALAALGLQSFQGGYDSDSVKSYEAGLKTTWNGGRTLANVSIYRIDWLGLQQTIALSQAVPTCGALITANVGEAQVDGMELEFQSRFFDNWMIGVTAAYTDAAISKADGRVPGSKVGNALQFIPKWAGSVSLQRDLFVVGDRTGYVRADWTYTDDRTATVGPTTNPFLELPSYSLLNLKFAITDKRWEGALFVENATDETPVYDSRGAAGAGFIRQVATGRPRTIGISATWRFGE